MRFLRDKLISGYSFLNYLKKSFKRQIIRGQALSHFIIPVFKGFWPDTYFLYKTNRLPLKYFVSDYKRIVKLSRLNNPYSYILDDKLVFEKFFKDTIKSIGSLKGSDVFIKETNSLTGLKDFLNNLHSKNKIVFKPRKGGGGRSVITLEYKTNSFIIDGREISLENLIEKLRQGQNYLIYNFFSQRGLSHDIFPHTLNTIRVLSIFDPNTKKPKVIRALHRFGTSSSIPVDNWSSGGICCNIDIQTGILSRGVILSKNGKIIWNDVHPDTGKQLCGIILPNWVKVIRAVEQFHAAMHFLPYIGWDLILHNEEIKILEANSNSDVNLFQIHEPLLLDKYFTRFLRNYNIK